ncbi:MAG: NAD(P)/FAD-dependent oxidoreductase, partial [Clostridia bacterium]
IYHNKIADELKQRAIDYGKNDIDGLCHVIKHFDYDVLGLGSFEQAQVMTGGIDTKTLKTTLEFRKTEGLYACGEAIDVDGLCGGYNLHWAFSSGIVAGKSE